MVYYGYRYYHPSLGRWIGKDPSQEDGGLNLYSAMLNSPICQVDSDGRRIAFASRIMPILAALSTMYHSLVKGTPMIGPMQQWARMIQMEATTAAASAARKLAASAGGGGNLGPPKFWQGTGVLWGIALTSLIATYESVGAAANLAIGNRSEIGTASYELEAAFISYAKGDSAYGDLDAIDAGLLSNGGAGEAALTSWDTYSQAGEAFQ